MPAGAAAVLRGPWGELLARATRKDPALRFPSAEEMLAEVTRVVGGLEAAGPRLAIRASPPRRALARSRCSAPTT